MQTLEIISINFWNILISLCNLVVLYFILKKFLYKPVQKVLKERQEKINESYARAESAESEANESKKLWSEKLAEVNAEADEILEKAAENAKARSQTIVEAGEAEAVRIRKQAEEDAVLTRKKAEDSIRQEIVDISLALSEKIIEREVNKEDHDALIDEFISRIGDEL